MRTRRWGRYEVQCDSLFEAVSTEEGFKGWEIVLDATAIDYAGNILRYSIQNILSVRKLSILVIAVYYRKE